MTVRSVRQLLPRPRPPIGLRILRSAALVPLRVLFAVASESSSPPDLLERPGTDPNTYPGSRSHS